MKRVILIIVLVFAALTVITSVAAWYLWRSWPPDRTVVPTEPEQAPPAEPVATETTEATETQPDHPQARRPRPVPPEPRTGDSSAPIERVDFDRRPWNPKGETREKYEHRAKLIAAFDRFVAETSMSEERARAVLMLMFDFQEMVRLLDEEFWSRKPFRDEWQFEHYNRKRSVDLRTVQFDTEERLRDMLSEEEMRAWRRNLENENIWLDLSFTPAFGCLVCPVGPLRDAYINRPLPTAFRRPDPPVTDRATPGD